MNDSLKCPCGSDFDREEIYDARGIFVTFCCLACKEEKLKAYRPDIFTDPNYWHDEPIDDNE